MNTRRKTAAGRIAALLATLGMLALSSGLALMLTATSASAEAGPKPCTEGTGWIEVDVSALTFTYDAPDDKLISEVCAKGPNEHPLFFAGPFNPGLESYDFDAADYGWLNDNDQVQEISHIGVRLVDPPEEEPLVTTASVTPVQPTCDNGNVAGYTTGGEHVTFGESAAPAPGTSIVVTATTEAGWEFEGGQTEKAFPLDFDVAETPCTFVDPPDGEDPPTVVVDPPTVVDPPSSTVVTPTVVNAGLGDLAGDVRAEQGLALVLAGMIMVMAAGGLGLVRISGRI